MLEDLKNIELNTLTFYGGRYIKNKTKTYSKKVYTKWRFKCARRWCRMQIFYNHFY